MRSAACFLALGLGAALVGAACCIPVVVVQAEAPSPGLDTAPPSFFQHYLMLPIVARALPLDAQSPGAEGTGGIPGTGAWPARLILLAAFASICLVAAGWRRAALAAAAALGVSVVWLFLESGAASGGAPSLAGGPAGWTAYPPLSAAAEPQSGWSFEGPGSVWVALAAATVLFAAAAWLREEDGRRRQGAAAPRED